MLRGGFHTGNGNVSIPPHLDLPPFQLPAFTLFRVQLGHPVGAPVRRKNADVVLCEAFLLPSSGIGAGATLDERVSSLGRWLYQVSALCIL